MKRILAYALLLSFIVVLSPREIWHSHDHTAEKSQAELRRQNSDNTFQAPDCFVCDFSLSLFTVPKESNFLKYNGAVVHRSIASVPIVEKDLRLYFPLRGPPTLV